MADESRRAFFCYPLLTPEEEVCPPPPMCRVRAERIKAGETTETPE